MTPFTDSLLQRLFPNADWDDVRRHLDSECSVNLPLIQVQGVVGIERVQCAVLKVSGGSVTRLHEAVRLAQIDWRDVLVAAGFGSSVTAHLELTSERPATESGDGS